MSSASQKSLEPAAAHPEPLESIDRCYLVPWGFREMLRVKLVLFPVQVAALFLCVLHSLAWAALLLPATALSLLLILFFRNPRRPAPAGAGLLVSPADGTVSDIATVDEPEFIHGPAVRVGIFLSIFSVHVNRAPAAGRIEWLAHREGAHHDARRPEAAASNESNLIGLVREDEGGPAGLRLLVRQVSGAIARRIVCPLEVGWHVRRGGLVGMIKYGSRTELFIPVSAGARLRVKVGDKVAGGSSVLAQL